MAARVPRSSFFEPTPITSPSKLAAAARTTHAPAHAGSNVDAQTVFVPSPPADVAAPSPTTVPAPPPTPAPVPSATPFVPPAGACSEPAAPIAPTPTQIMFFINATSADSPCSDADAFDMVDAQNDFMQKAFYTYWPSAPRVFTQFVARGQPLPAGVAACRITTTGRNLAVVKLVDKCDVEGAEGYHDEEAGACCGYVAVEDSLGPHGAVLFDTAAPNTGTPSQTWSHEAFEAVGDLYANGYSQRPFGRGTLFAQELCDAVQDGVVPWKAPGSGRTVALSNFILPRWFDPQAKYDPADPEGTKFDFLGVLRRPFSKTSGGYFISVIPQPDYGPNSKHALSIEDHEGHAHVLVGGGVPVAHKAKLVLAASFGPDVPLRVMARKLKSVHSRMARRGVAVTPSAAA